MSIKGYPDGQKSADGRADFVTVNPVRFQQFGLDAIAHAFVAEIASDTAEAGSTAREINAAANAARAGDLIRFTAGALSGYEERVLRKTTNQIVLAVPMPAAPTIGDPFTIYRQRMPTTDGATGALIVTTTGGPSREPAQFEFMRLAAAAINATYTSMGAIANDVMQMSVFNSLDATVRLSFDTGVNDHVELEAGESFSIDFGSNGVQIDANPEIQVKHLGVAPTSGTIRITLVGITP